VDPSTAGSGDLDIISDKNVAQGNGFALVWNGSTLQVLKPSTEAVNITGLSEGKWYHAAVMFANKGAGYFNISIFINGTYQNHNPSVSFSSSTEILLLGEGLMAQ